MSSVSLGSDMGIHVVEMLLSDAKTQSHTTPGVGCVCNAVKDTGKKCQNLLKKCRVTELDLATFLISSLYLEMSRY